MEIDRKKELPLLESRITTKQHHKTYSWMDEKPWWLSNSKSLHKRTKTVHDYSLQISILRKIYYGNWQATPKKTMLWNFLLWKIQISILAQMCRISKFSILKLTYSNYSYKTLHNLGRSKLPIFIKKHYLSATIFSH